MKNLIKKIFEFKKSIIIGILKIRGIFYINVSSTPENLYILTMQKSGSQWIKQVLNDRRIKKKTNLYLYPQHRYEWNEFHEKFPRGVFVPGLYMSYDLYEEIKKPTNHKTLCIMRDPRDIVVSWYFSMLKTHGLMGKVHKYRTELNNLDIDDGLHYCIDQLSIKLMAMRTWINNQHDSKIIIIKFEDLTSSPILKFEELFNFLNINFDKNELDTIISDYSKEEMRKKDLEKRKDKTSSHYREKSSSHASYFKKEHYDHFYEVTGNLVEVLGYER